MSRLMLDTNAASRVIRNDPAVVARLISKAPSDVCISAVTRGELLFGVARRPEAVSLRRTVDAFLLSVEALAWDRPAADRYGAARASLERRGRPLGALDMMIAAHAISVGAVLVTHDAAFGQVEGLELEDWEAG
jgi:tRNA(fMet)-specific endonuclease VapC